MPTIVRLSSISMYAADHLPPHFHVRLRDGREALIEIATLIPLSNKVPRRELAEALAWAEANKAALAAQWERLNP